MMRQAITWKEFGKKLDWDAVRRLEEAYYNITIPCLIVWGDRDETLPLSMGYKLKDQIPSARLVIVPNCKHLLPLEKPALCARLCRSFDPQVAGRWAPHSVTLAQAEPENLAMKP
jgi:pimeloyl-ACP methyl ester carboxylesterase